MGMQEDWKRIEQWTTANFPPGIFRQAAGAPQEKIAALEQTLGVVLPEDLKESYRLHDGSSQTPIPYSGTLLPIEEIGKMWLACRQWQQEEKWGSPNMTTTSHNRSRDRSSRSGGTPCAFASRTTAAAAA